MVVIVISPWSDDMMRWQHTIHTLSLESETLEREPILVISCVHWALLYIDTR